MKKRQSIHFAKWTKTREECYKKECDEILYRTKSKIIIDNDSIFKLKDNNKSLLLKINNTKSAWFQIWIKLRDDK